MSAGGHKKAVSDTKQAPSSIPQQRKKAGWKTAAMVLTMCAWAAVSVIATQYVVGIIMIKLLGAAQFSRPVWTAIYSAISYILAMLLVIMVPTLLARNLRRDSNVGINAKAKGKRDAQKERAQRKLASIEQRMELGLMGLPTWTDIGLAPIGFFISLVLVAIMVGIFTIFPWFDAEQVQNLGFSLYMSGGDRIIAFLTLVVMAPIAEEIIFRGWLYGKLRNQLLDRMPEWGGIIISILAVSVVFGAVHMQWNVGVNVFALSIVLCALREITGTIYAGILTHMIKNGVAFFLLYVIGIG